MGYACREPAEMSDTASGEVVPPPGANRDLPPGDVRVRIHRRMQGGGGGEKKEGIRLEDGAESGRRR